VRFAHPIWFLASIAIVGLIIGYGLAQRRRWRHTLRFANLELLEKVAPTRPGRVRHLPTAVILLGLILLTIALAGPTAATKAPRNRATLMLAIDVSLSMRSTDVAPNRLDAAKAAAMEFANDLTPGVNLGLVSFAGISSVLVSPTTDRAPTIAAIKALKLDQRTATGDAIISCLQTIEVFSKTISGADGPAPSRIVMMTDGKQTVGRSVDDAAAQAATAKVPISMIAFGTDHGTITFQGSVVPVPLDISSMQSIARISGGDFHTAATATELKKVYTQLGEQIGYELKQQDVSRPWLIAGTIMVMFGAAGALVVGGRIP